MIRMWQRFQRNFELVEIRINRVRINRARPVVGFHVNSDAKNPPYFLDYLPFLFQLL